MFDSRHDLVNRYFLACIVFVLFLCLCPDTGVANTTACQMSAEAKKINKESLQRKDICDQNDQNSPLLGSSFHHNHSPLVNCCLRGASTNRLDEQPPFLQGIKKSLCSLFTCYSVQGLMPPMNLGLNRSDRFFRQVFSRVGFPIYVVMVASISCHKGSI